LVFNVPSIRAIGARRNWPVALTVVFGLASGLLVTEIACRTFLFFELASRSKPAAAGDVYWPAPYTESSFGYDYGNESGVALQLKHDGNRVLGCDRHAYL
jgi:hypothetical protein